MVHRSPEAGAATPRCRRMGFLWAWTALLTIAAACGRTAEPPPAASVTPAQHDPPPAVTRQAAAARAVEAPERNATAEPEAQGPKLPLYELQITPQNLRNLERSAFSNQTVPATLVVGGTKYQVEVRHRGAWARSWPKKPLKIFFRGDKRLEDQRCLNLNSAWRDPAMVRECVAYSIYEACGTPSPRAQMVRLDINGKFWGVYVQVEQPDQAFLRRLNLKGASVYKADGHSNQSDERDLGSEDAYQQNYEKQTRKQEGYADLRNFCHELAQTKNVAQFFEQNVDVDRYVAYLAGTALTQNWDGFNKNHFLVYDGQGSRKWMVVPWDLDRTLGDHWNWSFSETELPPWLGTSRAPGVTGWNRLQDRFFSVPELRAKLADRLAQLLEKEFTPEKLFPLLDRLKAELGADAALDRRRWPGDHPDVPQGIEELKHFVEQRRAYLQAQLPALRNGSGGGVTDGLRARVRRVIGN